MAKCDVDPFLIRIASNHEELVGVTKKQKSEKNGRFRIFLIPTYEHIIIEVLQLVYDAV